MTRAEQIEEAARKIQTYAVVSTIEDGPMFPYLIHMAKWCDENPSIDLLAYGFNKMMPVAEAQMERADKLEAMLLIAEKALELYTGIAGTDCADSTTKWSAAEIALTKINEMKKETP